LRRQHRSASIGRKRVASTLARLETKRQRFGQCSGARRCMIFAVEESSLFDAFNSALSEGLQEGQELLMRESYYTFRRESHFAFTS
jgi:hypothetical protein